MRAAPPSDKGVGISLPPFRLQVWPCYFGKPRLHIHDRSILIEHADLDRGFENVSGLHGRATPWMHRMQSPATDREPTPCQRRELQCRRQIKPTAVVIPPRYVPLKDPHAAPCFSALEKT